MKKLIFSLLILLGYGLNAYAVVNINTATVEQLETLNGIGPSKVEAIVEYRKKNGNFKTVDDLNNVPGIGDKTMAKLRPELTVNGSPSPTPATPSTTPASAPSSASKKK